MGTSKIGPNSNTIMFATMTQLLNPKHLIDITLFGFHVLPSFGYLSFIDPS
jgi:hypothetical protein